MNGKFFIHLWSKNLWSSILFPNLKFNTKKKNIILHKRLALMPKNFVFVIVTIPSALNTVKFLIFSLNWRYWPYWIWYLSPGLHKCRRTNAAAISAQFLRLKENFGIWVFWFEILGIFTSVWFAILH